MLVRVFGNVMGFGSSAVVQGVMDIFVRRRAPHPLRQQGAEDHANHAERQPDQLRWHQAGFTEHEFNQLPGSKAANDGSQRTLRGSARPVSAEKEGNKGAGQRDFVGVFDHFED